MNRPVHGASHITHFMNTQHNHWFDHTAADPVLRRRAIADLTRRRAVLFCCALVVTASATAMFLTSTRQPNSPVLGCLATFLSWIVVIRVDSSRRVLTLIDRFFKDSDAKPLP